MRIKRFKLSSLFPCQCMTQVAYGISSGVVADGLSVHRRQQVLPCAVAVCVYGLCFCGYLAVLAANSLFKDVSAAVINKFCLYSVYGFAYKLTLCVVFFLLIAFTHKSVVFISFTQYSIYCPFLFYIRKQQQYDNNCPE